MQTPSEHTPIESEIRNGMIGQNSMPAPARGSADDKNWSGPHTELRRQDELIDTISANIDVLYSILVPVVDENRSDNTTMTPSAEPSGSPLAKNLYLSNERLRWIAERLVSLNKMIDL